MAQVEGESGAAWNHIGSGLSDFKQTDGAEQAGNFLGDFFDGEDEFRSACEGILAEIHRAGACMGRGSSEGEADSSLACDAGDDGERKIEGFQHRALLDVGFPIGHELAFSVAGLGTMRRGGNK